MNKFKPFYDKLIMPLISLSNLGCNYQGELLARELEELKKNKLVRRWYNIVQTCEAFNSMDIYGDPEMVFDNKQALTFITKNEAAELKKQHTKSIGEEETEDGSKERAIEYDPTASLTTTSFGSRSQTDLDKLVNK